MSTGNVKYLGKVVKELIYTETADYMAATVSNYKSLLRKVMNFFKTPLRG